MAISQSFSGKKYHLGAIYEAKKWLLSITVHITYFFTMGITFLSPPFIKKISRLSSKSWKNILKILISLTKASVSLVLVRPHFGYLSIGLMVIRLQQEWYKIKFYSKIKRRVEINPKLYLDFNYFE